MIRFCPLASGSKGNSFYVEIGSTIKFLIDAGLSAKALTERLQQLNVDIRDLSAIFITHEHIDHVRALDILSKKYAIPVIANLETAKAIQANATNKIPFKLFTSSEAFSFLDMHILPFRIRHDAQEPVGFSFTIDSLKIALATDLGEVTPTVVEALKNSNILVIEANHDPELVELSKRPSYYKWRVLSPVGHLSNENAAELIASVHHDRLEKVYLAHLSSECNTKEKAYEQVGQILQRHHIELPLSIAAQDCIGESHTCCRF